MLECPHFEREGISVNRTGVFLRGMALLLAAVPACAQDVTATVTRPAVGQLAPGQTIIEIVTQTRHPAYLDPQSLKTPDGVHILASGAAPDNARTCPRGAPSGSECRQVFRVQLDAGARCQAGGNYGALFRVNCWPGTAPSRCQPGAYPYEFKLEAHNLCGQ